MQDRKEHIREEMRKLISVSCRFKKHPAPHFQQFHKVYLKFYFDAIDVSLDYQSKIISIWNSKPLTTNLLRLFDINEAISVKVYYSNLEETLLGSLQEGHLQDSFYKKLLDEFAHFSEFKGNGGDAWSA